MREYSKIIKPIRTTDIKIVKREKKNQRNHRNHLKVVTKIRFIIFSLDLIFFLFLFLYFGLYRNTLSNFRSLTISSSPQLFIFIDGFCHLINPNGLLIVIGDIHNCLKKKCGVLMFKFFHF